MPTLRRTSQSKKQYGEENIFGQPQSLVVGQDICVATGLPLPADAIPGEDWGVMQSD